ncbi:MAG: hypothetical protein SGI96_07890 [Bacteroidota bacterium]|nr:hypothetical protein [Bacteroidota bacterium]
MKKFVSIITITAAIAVVMVSCKNNPVTPQVIYADTIGFAQFQEWKAMNEQPVVSTSSKTVALKRNTANKTTSMTSSTSSEAKVAKKKGWSNAAKYSVIGGGAGAVGGAIINKRNRVGGGVVGGIVLGGIGYGIGRAKDKKEGHY